MLTKEDARRVMIARVREWDTNMPGSSWFDSRDIEFAYVAHGLAPMLEAGLEHG